MSFVAEPRSNHSPNAISSLPRVESNAGAHPLALSELSTAPGGAAQAADSNPVISAVNPLHQVKTTLQVCVGSAAITVGELLGAKEQQVLLLDRSVMQPVDLVLEGHVVARGQLVAVGNQFAVRLTELPIPLNTGFAGRP